MRKLINISVLFFILSLLVVCSPEQDNIVVPEKGIVQENQNIIITHTNSNAFSVFKAEHKKHSENMVISPLNANAVSALVLYASNVANNLDKNETSDELINFNKQIFNHDTGLKINSQVDLNFNQSIKFSGSFNEFLKNTGHYSIKDKDTEFKNFKKALLNIKNNLEAKFSFSNQTGIGEAPFYLSPDKSKFVKMLICQSAFNYYDDEYMKVVEIPIGHANFSALFIVPETGFSLNRIVQTLNPYILKTISSNYRKLKMAVFIPEISINYYRESIEKSRYTNFKDIRTLALKNISSKENVYINNVIYHTNLKSISKIKNNKKLKISNSLFIDRPFVFIIKEKSSDAIVFIGKVVNP